MDWRLLANLRSIGDCVIIMADYNLCNSDTRVRNANNAIAARSPVPCYVIYFDQKSPEVTAMQQFILKNCPLFKITNSWKIFTVKAGQLASVNAILPQDSASIDEIFRLFAPPSQPVVRQSMMSISTGANRPAQIMEDKRLSEPEDFIPYNQEWRKMHPN